ncbi:hypothetical protein LDBPK_281270 [Leishmania donovani]|uniref:Leucine Rich repeat family protein n=1 Tax=Leishmania donovani TaxID=5661 RepID=E9BJJ8_LEIDO|nr:hypothetical protein LDBPK_281270 [Leishmania donovani]CBZ35532.1 hypothetical protein LDBPK_281270 [Leishmania donovani]
MGAVLRGAVGHLTADRHWGVDDLAPPPYLVPFPGASGADEHSARLYACGCLRALSADGWAKGKPIRWRIPESVSLSGMAGGGGGGADGRKTEGDPVADVLVQLVSALSSHQLVVFSVEGHSEVTAADVHQWASWLGTDALARAPAAPWSNIRVANLSDCSLGDAGVQAFLTIVFPSATSPSNEGSRHAVSAPHRAPLPLLESLILDGVGLTDRGAVWVTSYLDEVARCRVDARPFGDRDDASASPCKRCLLHTLSLQRNTLGAVGVLKLLHASLANPRSAGSANGHTVESVDPSWNSLASVPRGCVGEEENSSAARRKLLIALGAGMVRSTCEIQPPAASGEASPPRRSSLLLEGCGADEADARALYTEGLLFAFLECFREAAHREVGDLPHSPARQVLLPPVGMQVTKIDLSHNPCLGDAGVRQLLSALLCLEATREVSRSMWHPLGSAQHTFVGVEEIVLREVGCTDAVLVDVVRLLSSNIHRAIPGLVQQGSAARELSDLEAVFEEEVHRTLLDEARFLAGIREERVPQSTESAENGHLTRCTYLPSLRLLDLSENSFYSADLIGAVMAGAALRVSYAPSRASDSAVTEHHTGQRHGGLAPRQRVLSATAGEHSFALGLEECGLADAALLQLPLSLQMLRAVMPKYEEPLFSTDFCPPPVAPRHPIQPQSCRCTWYLGGNHLTHSELLRLRKFTETLARSTSVGIRLCSVNAYVERNAILHPATTVKESDEDDMEGSGAAAVDASGVSWLGISAAEDNVRGGSITERAASGSEAGFADRCLALHDFTAPRVSWHQLPSLYNLATAEKARDPCQLSIASKSLQRCGPQANATGLGTCPAHSVRLSASGAAAPAPVAALTAPEMRSGQACAHLSRGTSGKHEPSRADTDGDSDEWVGMMGFHDDRSALWASLSPMTVSTNDLIDALIAEAEQVMRERSPFVEVGRQLASADLLSGLPPLSPPDTYSGLE